MTFSTPRTVARVIGSAVAGFATFYAVALAIRFSVGRSWLFHHYCDVLGLPTLFGRIADPFYYMGANDTGMDPRSAFADRIAFCVMITFWTLLFGGLFFCFVFRGSRRNLTRRCS